MATESKSSRPATLSLHPPPRFECLIFDMDDTLYPPSTGLMRACTNAIIDYIKERLHLDDNAAQNLNARLYKLYGSSLAGLVAGGYKCDFIEYNRYIHGSLPYKNLMRDDTLRKLLLSMPQRKVVFTNGNKEHAHRTLEELGIKDCFEQIVCFDNLNMKANFGSSVPIICKPSTKAFHRALQLLQADASKTLFFDDSPWNIEGAKAIGLWTCLTGSSKKMKGADYVIESIHDIREKIPNIWSTNVE
ncbi:hypothetical protein GOP47_0018415 [Adiantum capillus-veneris]|uniref:Pyrimidine 5-nucleotidase n=1 Tax=Adiantum capillus-veneris TaxID=13818 RepID=A0A9D4UEM1_ADICA|nr:hypothetical protein GOP47_0018415 [Adiantum capillus-veneris]